MKHEPYSKKIVSPEEFNRRKETSFPKARVVFTNGCFDLLHPGHVEYLYKSKSLGDILAIGLNSDLSVSRIKGPQRPINSEMDRALVLAALSCVDFIMLFSQDTPLKLIKSIRPDCLIKGGDWKQEEIVGKKEVEETGGEVLSIPLKPGFSTSLIIQKILDNYKKQTPF